MVQIAGHESNERDVVILLRFRLPRRSSWSAACSATQDLADDKHMHPSHDAPKIECPYDEIFLQYRGCDCVHNRIIVASTQWCIRMCNNCSSFPPSSYLRNRLRGKEWRMIYTALELQAVMNRRDGKTQCRGRQHGRRYEALI
jgi:hypothetical protein